MPKKWRKKQKRDVRDFDGKETPRSGGFWSFAGDVEQEKFLIESKYTDGKGYRLTKETWNKIEHEALMSGKLPMMSIQIQDTEVVILSKFDFMELLKNESN